MRRVVLPYIFILLIVAVGAASGTVSAASSAPLHLQDRAFMSYAIEQDLAQVALGTLAAEKAADAEVRRFAESALAHHRRSLARLRAAAARLAVQPPAALNPVARRTEATLKGLSGPAFDRAYLTSQAIANFNGMYGARREMAHGFDAELRAEGARQAEALRANRRAAERIAGRIGPASANGLTAEDRNFLLYAMHVDMAQRGFAEIAAERGRDERVRTLARDLVAYHARSYDRLVQLATAKGLEPLREVSAITSGTQERMRGMTGLPLDFTFLNAQAFTSYGAHYRYEREAIRGGDPEVKALAAEAARDARRQHWQALHIINDWNWGAATS